MKALTLTQPYASLIAIGAKRIETRGWRTHHRGPIAIHAGIGLGPVGGVAGLRTIVNREPFRAVLAAWDRHWGTDILGEPSYYLPRRRIVAVANLVDCVPTANVDAPHHGTATWRAGNRWWVLTDQERAFGDYSQGRYAWLLADVRRLERPVLARGAQGLWTLPADVQAAVEEALAPLDKGNTHATE